MSNDEQQPGRFRKRLDRFRKVRSSTPKNAQKIAGFAFAAATAFGTIYAGFASFGAVPFRLVYLGLLLLFGAALGALFGWRSLGKAGLAGIGAGLWIFFELILAGFALFIEAISVGVVAALSSCSL